VKFKEFRSNKTIQYISLLLLSIICFILWRGELEYHGWAGLNWISYFHWAMPAGLLLYLVWTNLILDITFKTRALYNNVAIILLGGGFALFYYLCIHTFSRWSFMSDIPYYIFQNGIWVLPAVAPIIVSGVLLLLKLTVNTKNLVISVFGMAVALYISPYILELLNHKGSHNHIHAFKSGIIIIPYVFFLGLPFIGLRQRTSTSTWTSTST
jgi:hypothetical protein